MEENAGREELKKSKGRREEGAAERAGSMEIRAEIYGKYQQSNERGIKIAGKGEKRFERPERAEIKRGRHNEEKQKEKPEKQKGEAIFIASP